MSLKSLGSVQLIASSHFSQKSCLFVMCPKSMLMQLFFSSRTCRRLFKGFKIFSPTNLIMLFDKSMDFKPSVLMNRSASSRFKRLLLRSRLTSCSNGIKSWLVMISNDEFTIEISLRFGKNLPSPCGKRWQIWFWIFKISTLSFENLSRWFCETFATTSLSLDTVKFLTSHV